MTSLPLVWYGKDHTDDDTNTWISNTNTSSYIYSIKLHFLGFFLIHINSGSATISRPCLNHLWPNLLWHLRLSWPLRVKKQFYGSETSHGQVCVNAGRPRQNGHHFADDICECISWIKLHIKFKLKYDPWVLINNMSALVQVMAWGPSQ